MSYVEGLGRAYVRDNGIFIRNTTMCVARTKDFPQDHWGDLKIPYNLTAESLRYRSVDKALTDNQQLTSLVGHSLAGSVILEMQKKYPDMNVKNNNMWSTNNKHYNA